jgi:hypothetical protein
MSDEPQKPGYAVALDMHDFNTRLKDVQTDIISMRASQVTLEGIRLLLLEKMTDCAKAHSEKMLSSEDKIWRAIDALQRIAWGALGAWGLFSLLFIAWVTFHAK